ncbi:hypothetical protein COY28_02120 [Candidatus Woesearchaeota archaeon CG_4_10_14_0_2_um_filter_57_5]|nr:MAG: hypothetical protein COY28_02120 [Candidatus Woesearchaeota archaeon CG_4_10_14_0_2_um_filter_57_5]
MGLDKLAAALGDEARKEATALVDAAREEASRIAENAQQQIAQANAQADAEMKRAATEMERQEIAAAELEGKDLVNQAKRRLIDDTRAAALDTLATMPKEKKAQLYQDLLDRAQDTMKLASVFCAQKDLELVKGLKGVAKSSVTATPIRGGLVMEDNDGSVRLDVSFESLVQEAMEQRMADVAGVLLGR